MTHSLSVSGPLPISSEFRGYEDAVPGAGDRIISMAEKELDARIAINDRDSRAVNRGFLLGTFGTAYLPWFLGALTVVLVAIDASGFAVAAGLLTALTATPGLVVNIRNAFNRGTPDDEV